MTCETSIPIGSMYGIYANIWGILMVNVTIYGIHGSYGIHQKVIEGINLLEKYGHAMKHIFFSHGHVVT